MIQEKYLVSVGSRQSNETKQRTQLVLASQEPWLLYLEFNNPKKQNVSEINLF